MNTTLIRNADVFAPEPLGTRDLLLGGGKILWVGANAPELPAAYGADTIDLQGRRLVPGLIDGHVHVTGGGGEAGFASRVPAPMPSRYTRAGVTTVVGLLGTDDVARGTRELVAQVNALREEGLSAYGYAGGYHLPPATLTGSVRADLVFIDCLLGVGELAISDHRSSQPTLDELMRIASEAHVAGLMTGKAGIVHLHLGDGPRGLDLVRRALDESELPPRVFNPTHVNRRRALFDEAIELARRELEDRLNPEVEAFGDEPPLATLPRLLSAAAIRNITFSTLHTDDRRVELSGEAGSEADYAAWRQTVEATRLAVALEPEPLPNGSLRFSGTLIRREALP